MILSCFSSFRTVLHLFFLFCKFYLHLPHELQRGLVNFVELLHVLLLPLLVFLLELCFFSDCLLLPLQLLVHAQSCCPLPFGNVLGLVLLGEREEARQEVSAFSGEDALDRSGAAWAAAPCCGD